MIKATIAVAVGAILAFCWWSYRKAQIDGASVMAIRERSAPTGTTCTTAKIVDTVSQREATWQCETKMSWQEYSSWVTTNLGSDFRRIPTDDGSLWFGKLSASDAFQLHITGKATAEYLQLDLYYREYAD